MSIFFFPLLLSPSPTGRLPATSSPLPAPHAPAPAALTLLSSSPHAFAVELHAALAMAALQSGCADAANPHRRRTDAAEPSSKKKREEEQESLSPPLRHAPSPEPMYHRRQISSPWPWSRRRSSWLRPWGRRNLPRQRPYMGPLELTRGHGPSELAGG